MYALIINVPVLLAGIWVFMKKMRDCIPTLRFVTYTATKNVLSFRNGVFHVSDILRHDYEY